MLHTDSRRRERILVYGSWSSGKSSAWLAIGLWIAKTNSTSKMYVVDTDRAWEAMDPGTLDGTMVVRNSPEWTDIKTNTQELVAAGGRDDWLIVDLADKPWTKAQSDYWETVSGKDFDEFLQEGSRTGNLDLAGDHGKHWGFINKKYDTFSSALQRFPGHILVCTGASEVRQPNKSGKGGDSTELRQEYGRFGYRPTGQKDLAHLFHTVLFMQEKKVGEEWVMSTVKERGPIGQPKRPYLKGQIVQDFVMSYLIPVAGWRP